MDFIMLQNVKLDWLNAFNIYLRRGIDLLFEPVPGYSNETKFQILISLGFSDYSLWVH